MGLPPYVPERKSELIDLHGWLYLSAPDNFYRLPNELPEEQSTLESTVAEMHRGVDYVFRKPKHEEVRARLHDILDRMYKTYKAGDQAGGMTISLEFRELVQQTRV